MADVDNTDHIIHSSDVLKAAQKLRAKKPDGEKDYCHIILNLSKRNYLIT